MELSDKTILYTPQLMEFEKEGIYVFIDGEYPNWITCDRRGAYIVNLINGKRSFHDLVKEYSTYFNLDLYKSWLHVYSFINSGIRHKMISTSIFPERSDYKGRGDYLRLTRLNEFWIHTNNSCNLECNHCLCDSSPGEDKGLNTEDIIRIIDEVQELGVRRYYLTGGEPFLRKDIFELIDYITDKKESELIILTNATLLNGGNLKKISSIDRDRLKIQVSLDGTTPEVNDRFRGEGSFYKIIEGVKNITKLGFDLSITSVAAKENMEDILGMPSLAKRLGVKSLHLMWMHRRGRALKAMKEEFPSSNELIKLVMDFKKRTDNEGLQFDNYESLRLRANGRSGIKYDLGNACWDSLCLYSDGHIYPSAAFANNTVFDCGDALKESVKTIWRESYVTKMIRDATLQKKGDIKNDPFRFLTGGGDIEHAYFYSESVSERGDILGVDPYYDLYREIIKEIMIETARKKRYLHERNITGYDAPIIFHFMGDGGAVCEGDNGYMDDNTVTTLHSNCVLSFDVERPYKVVQEFYGKAALKPDANLCCPTANSQEDISHIPADVLDRSYGCGSPIQMADIKEGEIIVDLGSGAGIDCFIAAKKTGQRGRIIGIDMTDEMIDVANKNNILVAENLGFDIVEFQKGFLENIPVEESIIDLITSNCVINLSPDKKGVFREIWRILKNYGRMVVSDIVSQGEVPPHIKVNEELWGECIGGALTEDEFLAYLEEVGFYGIEVIKKVFWREIDGYSFYSITVRGYKFEKKEGCLYKGDKAVYHGPFKAVVDEEGHLFPRDEAIDVCTDTASKLKSLPYSTYFTVMSSEDKEEFSNVRGCGTVSDKGECC